MEQVWNPSGASGVRSECHAGPGEEAILIVIILSSVGAGGSRADQRQAQTMQTSIGSKRA